MLVDVVKFLINLAIRVFSIVNFEYNLIKAVKAYSLTVSVVCWNSITF